MWPALPAGVRSPASMTSRRRRRSSGDRKRSRLWLPKRLIAWVGLRISDISQSIKIRV